MTFLDRYKELDRKASDNKILIVGMLLIICGSLLISLSMLLNATPDFKDLNIISGQLTATPLSSSHPREGVHGWIYLGEKRYQINGVCFLPHSHCRLPANVLNLKAGDSITLWVSDKHLNWDKSPSEVSYGRIWQLQKDDSVLLDFKDLALANYNENKRGNFISEILIGIGILLVLIQYLVKARKSGFSVKTKS